MDHHAISHINSTMGNARSIIGPHKEHQIARLGIGYRRGDIVEPLGAQPPGVAQAGTGQHIADEAGTVKRCLRAAPAPHIGIPQIFLRLGDEGGEPLIRQILGGDVPGRGWVLNVQTIVDRDVDLGEAAEKIIIGRSFDNGLICLGEQCAFIPEEKFDAFVEEFKKHGGYYIEDEATADKLRECIFPGGGDISRNVVGLTAEQVAALIGLEVPAGTRVLAAKVKAIAQGDVMCREKLCPVLGLMPYGTFEEGVAMMVANLEYEGKGHSIGIHSNDPARVEYAGIQCSVSRVVVNQPSGTTGGGSPTNGFTPTTTLGCGSWGNNSFSGNFDMVHLMNITRVGYPLDESWLPDPEMAWKD